MRLRSISNHKLYKNVYLEKIRSVVQYIVLSQTDLTVKFIHQQMHFTCVKTQLCLYLFY